VHHLWVELEDALSIAKRSVSEPCRRAAPAVHRFDPELWPM